MSLFMENFAIASIFQYFTVTVFCYMCLSFLKKVSTNVRDPNANTPFTERSTPFTEKSTHNYADVTELQQWHDAFPKVGFLGVWSFIILGCLKQFIYFNLSFVEAHAVVLGDVFEGHSIKPDAFRKIQDAVNGTLGICHSFATILCIINMYVICNLPIIMEGLPQAAVKFMGTRALLLVNSVQAHALIGEHSLGPAAAI